MQSQNAELRRENEALKTQIYSLTANSHPMPPSNSMSSAHLQHYAHSNLDSPSISSTIDSLCETGSPSPSLGSEKIPMIGLPLTSSGYCSVPPRYCDTTLLSYFPSQQHYSMVQPSNVRSHVRNSLESSDFGSPQPPSMGRPGYVQYVKLQHEKYEDEYLAR